jgi:outer membrane lipoprotein-sorting protein
VIRLIAGVGLLIVPGWAAAPDVMDVLKGIELRYNRAQTVDVLFEQTFTAPRRGPKTERGELFLRKPGRMRWQYTAPAGKLFVSDGKYIYLYTPSTHRVERSKVKESDDLRAPLAFLLGKLDFQRDFKRFVSRPRGEDLLITAGSRDRRPGQLRDAVPLPRREAEPGAERQAVPLRGAGRHGDGGGDALGELWRNGF